MNATCGQCGKPWSLTHTCEGQPESVVPSLARLTAVIDQIHGLVDHSPELSSVEVVMRIQRLLDEELRRGTGT